MAKTQYTAPSGTTYTQVNDSVYNWQNGVRSGNIELRPNSGGPIGHYNQYMGSTQAPEFRPLSQEYLQKHLENIQNGLKTDGFQSVPSIWDRIKNKVKEKITKVNKEGDKLNYLNYIN